MNSPLQRAWLISLPVWIALLFLCWRNPVGDHWLTVEPPKAQCEAYDTHQLATSQVLSSEIYDDRKLDRLVREPQNTVSNLPYMIAGLAILLAGRRPGSIALGLAGLFLGIGSGMYHASLLPEWRMIDILGVYAVLYCLVLVGTAARFRRLASGGVAWVLAILSWALAIYTGVHRNDVRWQDFKIFDSTYVFIAAVAAGSVLAFLAYWRTADRRRYLRCAVVLVTAALISFTGGLGDRFGGFLANPEAFIQGHAIWHTFGAVALLAAYEIFASTGYDASTLWRAAN